MWVFKYLESPSLKHIYCTMDSESRMHSYPENLIAGQSQETHKRGFHNIPSLGD